MQDEHKERLRSNMVFLIENLTDVDGVLDHLIEKKIFRDAMVEEIRVASTRRAKVRDLLSRLPRRGPQAFQVFLDALNECEETECAARLTVGPEGDAASEVPRPVQALPDVEEEELPDTWPDSSNAPGEVELVLCQKSPESLELMKRVIKKNKMYPMLREKRGDCYIINNHDYSLARSRGMNLSDRTGTDRDCEELNKLFSQLGFTTYFQRDLKARGMQRYLLHAAEQDHSKADCLLVFLLAHGDRGVVLGVDGEPVCIHDIWQQFNGKGCPTMAGKPKLIFIQACQGSVGDEGVARSMTGSQPSESVDVDDGGQLSQQFQGLEVKDAEGEIKDATNAHMMVVRATHPGVMSWRKTDYGTWFIQAIVYVFKRFAHRKDLNSLMTMVNQLVNKAETGHGLKQVSVYESSLLQDLYFFPGLYQEGSDLKFSSGK